jgi:hypothetical protein
VTPSGMTTAPAQVLLLLLSVLVPVTSVPEIENVPPPSQLTVVGNGVACADVVTIENNELTRAITIHRCIARLGVDILIFTMLSSQNKG